MSSDLQHQASEGPALTNDEGKKHIDGWLNYRLRITIDDSRAFEGRFKCVDRDCNIVLAGTEEFKDSKPSAPLLPFCGPCISSSAMHKRLTSGEQRRFLGLIVIPGIHIKIVELIPNSHYNI